MTWNIFHPALSLFTLGAVLVFALWSRARTKEDTAPKSTLAKDGPQGGIEFLKQE